MAQKPAKLHTICAYTTIDGSKLDKSWRGTASFSFYENKAWIRIAKELAIAKQNSSALPIVFSDARSVTHLIFKGYIEKVTVWSDRTPARTKLNVTDLEKLKKPVLKTRLAVPSTGQKLSVGKRSSYVICETPSWLGSIETLRPSSRDAVDMAQTAVEGGRRMQTHLRIERDRGLRRLKIDKVLKSKGRLACEVCLFDFQVYRNLGEGFCEIHHLRPLSEVLSKVRTSLDDLAVVCANCHRMIHRTGESQTLSFVRSSLKSRRKP